MGNQQAKVDDWEIGWLAGFVDGEGSIMLMQHTSRGRLKHERWNPRITICGTHVATLNRMTKLLENLGLPYNVGWRDLSKVKSHWRKAWDLRVSGYKRCQRWLNMITPYLCTKREQAECMLDLFQSRDEHGQRDMYTERELDLIFQLRRMNHQLASTTTRKTRQFVMV